jgi:hypothetical protein
MNNLLPAIIYWLNFLYSFVYLPVDDGKLLKMHVELHFSFE